jgi:hypothetical protein
MNRPTWSLENTTHPVAAEWTWSELMDLLAALRQAGIPDDRLEQAANLAVSLPVQ